MYEEYMQNFLNYPVNGYRNTYDQMVENYPYSYSSQNMFEYDYNQNWNDMQNRNSMQIDELESCYPEYCEKLKKLQTIYNIDTKITVITHYPEEINQTSSSFFDVFLFCDNVENIDTKAKNLRSQNIRVIKALIDRSDFCVCNLDKTIFAEKIRKYVSQKPKATLLDLSISL